MSQAPVSHASAATSGRNFAELFADVRAWFERAAAAGWLSAEQVQRFHAIEHATPRDLFVAGSPRPLVVAFFGGTGVGKSSLLNRLAGAAIARTGVERPTSFEVTLYAHEQVELGELPAEMPVERVKVARHAVENQRDVLWMDVPDIDSTHEENRSCALAWLPYVDLVVYVVSPERYRDDVGWRLLLEREHKHGWLFVINRWDEGDPAQRDDFIAILRQAGFAEPLVLATSCARGATAIADDFERMTATLRGVIAEHGVRELERLGYRARALELQQVLRGLLPTFGEESRWNAVEGVFDQRWRQACDAVRDSVDLALRAVAARLAQRDEGVFDRLKTRAKNVVSRQRSALLTAATGLRFPGTPAPSENRAEPRPPGPAPSSALESNAAEGRMLADTSAILSPGEMVHLLRGFWDDWTEGHLTACLHAVEVELRRAALPVTPALAALTAVAADMRSLVFAAAERRARLALASPAAPWRVMLGRAARWLTYALPGAALLFVGAVVVYRFGSAAVSDRGAFLGLDFAIHAALLIIVAWALPFAAEHALRPRMNRVLLEALKQGVADGLAEVRTRIAAALHGLSQDALQYREEARALHDRVARYAPPEPLESGALRRLLAKPLADDQPVC